MGDKTLQ